MSLFFVLSGFIIHYNYAATVKNFSARGLWDFFVARFSRLYPMFFLVLLYDVACGSFFLYASETERMPYFEVLPYYLTLTQSWFYGSVGTHPIGFAYHYSFVAWSISTEFFLYLTYPFINFLALRVTKVKPAALLALAICIVSTVLLAWLKSHLPTIDHWGTAIGVVENPNADPGTRFSDWLNYVSPYTRVPEFMTGCMLAHLYMRASSTPTKIELIGVRVAVILALVDIGLFVIQDYVPVRWVGATGLLPALAILIFCCARYDIGFTRFLSGTTVVRLGEASYSMYLLHLIIIEKSAPHDAGALYARKPNHLYSSHNLDSGDYGHHVFGILSRRGGARPKMATCEASST